MHATSSVAMVSAKIVVASILLLLAVAGIVCLGCPFDYRVRVTVSNQRGGQIHCYRQLGISSHA